MLVERIFKQGPDEFDILISTLLDQWFEALFDYTYAVEIARLDLLDRVFDNLVLAHRLFNQGHSLLYLHIHILQQSIRVYFIAFLILNNGEHDLSFFDNSCYRFTELFIVFFFMVWLESKFYFFRARKWWAHLDSINCLLIFLFYEFLWWNILFWLTMFRKLTFVKRNFSTYIQARVVTNDLIRLRWFLSFDRVNDLVDIGETSILLCIAFPSDQVILVDKSLDSKRLSAELRLDLLGFFGFPRYELLDIVPLKVFLLPLFRKRQYYLFFCTIDCKIIWVILIYQLDTWLGLVLLNDLIAFIFNDSCRLFFDYLLLFFFSGLLCTFFFHIILQEFDCFDSGRLFEVQRLVLIFQVLMVEALFLFLHIV